MMIYALVYMIKSIEPKGFNVFPLTLDFTSWKSNVCFHLHTRFHINLKIDNFLFMNDAFLTDSN